MKRAFPSLTAALAATALLLTTGCTKVIAPPTTIPPATPVVKEVVTDKGTLLFVFYADKTMKVVTVQKDATWIARDADSR